jgi:hypothetical protein
MLQNAPPLRPGARAADIRRKPLLKSCLQSKGGGATVAHKVAHADIPIWGDRCRVNVLILFYALDRTSQSDASNTDN